MKRYVLMTICGLSLLSFCAPANAQAPVPGQPYQIPDGYTGYGAGTVIIYGGYNYVLNSDATMVLADQAAYSSQPGADQGAGQAYQIPDGYGSFPAGSVIDYGGANYTIGLNGTMVLVTNFRYSSQYVSPGGSSRQVINPGLVRNPGDQRGGNQPGWNQGLARNSQGQGGGSQPTGNNRQQGGQGGGRRRR